MAERVFRNYYCPQLNVTIRINVDSAKGPGRERIAASKQVAKNTRSECPLIPLGECDCEIAWLFAASDKEIWGDFV